MSKNFSYAVVLTGSIATGKSTVISLLKLHGLKCIDADVISHEILNNHYKDIKNLFGAKYVNKDIVNRKKLGELIFKNKEEKKRLEDFLHPKIYKQILDESLRFEKLKFPYLIDIPLFFEKKSYDIKTVVVVYTPKTLQLKRLINRNNLSKQEALQKIEAQIDIEDKKQKATFVIDNSSSLKHLQEECEKFVEKIKFIKLQDHV